VNLGIVGLVIALAIAFLALARTRQLVRLTGLAEYSALAGIIVGIFVNGCAESVFVMPRDMGLISALVVFSLAIVHRSNEVDARARSAVRETESCVEPLWGGKLSQSQLRTN
jgi:hypothetical protein